MIRFSLLKPRRHLTLRLGFAVLAVIGSHEAAAALPVDAHVKGVWGPLKDWPLIAIHSILLRDGRVLTYGADRFGQPTGFFYDVWDPVSDVHQDLGNVFTETNIFCSAHVLLPDSNSVLLAGGSLYDQNNKNVNKGNSDANLFSGNTNDLTQDGSGMERQRWYATTTTLANGKTYIQGGKGSGPSNTAGHIYPEVRDVDGSYQLLSNINTSTLSWYYPRNHVAPDGRVFGYDVKGYTYFLSPDLGSITFTGRLPNTGGNRSRSATSVMYEAGKILNFGGPSNGSNIIDITGVTWKVTPSGPLAKAGHWPNGTVLPHGRVLATGGSTVDTSLSAASAAGAVAGAEYRAQIWNPNTRTWAVKASSVSGDPDALPWLYHSTALLLPDATVLVAGGGANGGAGPINNPNAQIYSPPYLFRAGAGGVGSVKAIRPVITSAPAGAISPGDPFSFGVSGIVNRVTVVKTGAVTHAFNMDQRFVELPFERSGDTLTVTPHPNPAVLTPGAYMLFVLGDQDVPSIAKIISVEIVP